MTGTICEDIREYLDNIVSGKWLLRFPPPSFANLPRRPGQKKRADGTRDKSAPRWRGPASLPATNGKENWKRWETFYAGAIERDLLRYRPVSRREKQVIDGRDTITVLSVRTFEGAK